jgi:glyoxylase-like metal-dependent hydrolase (beta-lactamase superfamily II)
MEHPSAGVELLDEVLLKPGGGAFLLDVRNPVEAERWRPQGPGLRGYANVPYYEFIEDEDAAAARVPPGSQAYVLCAKGGSSAYVADVLRERGIEATNIAGGMIAWAAYHRFVRVNPGTEPFAIYQVVRPAKGCLSYVIASGGEAVIVDTTRNIDAYAEFVSDRDLRIVATLDTHLHADHISGGAALAARAAVPYYLARDDAQGAAVAHQDMPPALFVGDVPIEIVTLPVPGHTLGSTAVLVANRYLLSGDTLLPEGVGRPDLGNKAGEWTGFLYDSLKDVLSRLSGDTIVLPAHAASADDYDMRGSCVRGLRGLLSAANIADRSAFLEQIERAVSKTTQPPEYAQIRRVNLGETVTPEKADELEIGMNRCALSSARG